MEIKGIMEYKHDLCTSFNAFRTLYIIDFVCRIVIGLMLCLKFKHHFKYDLNDIKRNKKKIITVAITALTIVEIFYFTSFWKFVANKNEAFLIFSPMPYIVIFLISHLKTVVLAPVIEEMIYRKLFFLEIKPKQKLESAIKRHEWYIIFRYFVIMIASSILFAAVHYYGREEFFFPCMPFYYTSVGVLLCLCCELSGSIFSSMLLHMFFNTFITVQDFIASYFLRT